MAVAIQRPLRGSRISSFYPVKKLPSLASLDSAFQLQEYISLLIRLDPHDVDHIVSVPGRGSARDKETDADERDADGISKNEVSVDDACWIYEQLRRLAQDLSHPLITVLQQECTRATCPEMKAGEWLYLCVAHGNEGAMEQCCAIDYIIHTLDSATALLNSPRAFPSRLSIPQTSHRHFSSLARRLGRIFAHAYFHHREAFEQAEAESSLYARFLALTAKFDLVPSEFLVIPPRMAGIIAMARGHEGQPDDRGGEYEGEGENGGLGEPSVPPLIRVLARGTDDHAEAPPEESIPEFGTEAPPRDKSPLGALLGSPRKPGRSRTDTMVFSEGFSVAEELAKVEAEAGGEGAHSDGEVDSSAVVLDAHELADIDPLSHSPPEPEPEPAVPESPSLLAPEEEQHTSPTESAEDPEPLTTEMDTEGPVEEDAGEGADEALEVPSEESILHDPFASDEELASDDLEDAPVNHHGDEHEFSPALVPDPEVGPGGFIMLAPAAEQCTVVEDGSLVCTLADTAADETSNEAAQEEAEGKSADPAAVTEEKHEDEPTASDEEAAGDERPAAAAADEAEAEETEEEEAEEEEAEELHLAAVHEPGTSDVSDVDPLKTKVEAPTPDATPASAPEPEHVLAAAEELDNIDAPRGLDAAIVDVAEAEEHEEEEEGEVTTTAGETKAEAKEAAEDA